MRKTSGKKNGSGDPAISFTSIYSVKIRSQSLSIVHSTPRPTLIHRPQSGCPASESKPKSGGNMKKIKGARTKPSWHPPHKTCNAKSKHLIYLHGLTLSFFFLTISMNTRQKTSGQLGKVGRRFFVECSWK